MIEKILQDFNERGWSYHLNILNEADLTSINQYIDQYRKDFSPAKVGQKQSRERNVEIRGDHTLWLDPLSPPKEFSKLFDFLKKLKESMNQRFFLGLKEYECHLAYYEPGSFYKKHLDRFEKDSSRTLSFIFYLHQSWNENDGGELVLYEQDGQILKRISPTPGSFICFLSSDFPHEVRPGKKERRSLTGWMHTKLIN